MAILFRREQFTFRDYISRIMVEKRQETQDYEKKIKKELRKAVSSKSLISKLKYLKPLHNDHSRKTLSVVVSDKIIK